MATGNMDGSAFLSTAAVELSGVFARLVESGATAKVAYTKILEELLVRHEQIPSGTQLMELVSSFNRTIGAGGTKLPLGTAGTAADAVAAFRSKVAKGYRTRMPLSTLSPDLTQRVAALFDGIVVEIRDTLAMNYNHELEAAHARHQEEIGQVRITAEAEREMLRSQRADLNQQLDAANEVVNQLERASAQKDERIADLVGALDSLQNRFHLAASTEAVAREKIAHLGSKVRELESAHAGAVIAEAEERKSRMLTLDSSRQMALSLERESQQHQALKQRFLDLQSQMKEESTRGEQAQAQVVSLFEQCASLERSLMSMASARSSPAKSKPFRKSK